MNNKNFVEAKYTQQKISEYVGNPLIEALPDILEDPIHVALALTKYPRYDIEDLSLPAIYRMHMVKNIKEFFKPLSVHYLLEQIISRLIRNGYVNRNPFIYNASVPKFNWQKYPPQNNAPTVTPQLGIFGISGIGKTSLIGKILSMYPQGILHTNYNGDTTVRYQITWLHVETPANCTPKGLCLNLLSKIDLLFEENLYYQKGVNKRTYELPNYIKSILDIHSVGILVFDELQNLRGIEGKKQEQILNFFVELSNTISVPIILIGTLKALPLFNTEFRNARRICGDETIIWNRIEKDEEWDAFVKDLFKFQYTNHRVEISDDLKDLLYKESQGITDIVVKLFMLAQYRAISSGKEKITKGIISAVAKDCLKPVRPIIDALKNNDIKKLDNYQDVYLSEKLWDNIITSEENKAITYSTNKTTAKNTNNITLLNSKKVAIASWLIQGGFKIAESEATATEVIKAYGIETDPNQLNRYAYEILMNKKSLIPDKDVISRKKTTKEPSGILILYDKNINSKIPFYNILKESNYIVDINEFII